MTTTTAKPKRKYFLNRPILAIVAIIACTMLGWLGYYAYLDWADARALNEYLVQLEEREPNWRERVYGKPPTEAVTEADKQLRELNKLTESDMEAWNIYRSAYFAGMIQNPLEPAALFTVEQEEYLKWVNEQYKKMLEKSHVLESENIIPYYFDASLPYEKMQAAGYSLFGDTYTNHEFIELQFFLALQQNDSKQAVTSLIRLIKERRRKHFPGMMNQVNIHPGYVERLLNMTQPDDATLQKLQAALTQYLEESPQQFILIGTTLRLLSKYLDELPHADFNYRDLQHGLFQWVMDKDSVLRQDWLKPVFVWLANTKIKNMFRRSAHLKLKIYQLSEAVESLAALPETRRWPTWKQYASAKNIAFRMEDMMKQKPPASNFFPEGLQYLLYPYLYSVTSCIEKQAMHQAALTAVIAEQYRHKHGRFPQSWAELVPEYFPAPLLDPFTGKPLIIHTSEAGILVYSLGPDEIDHEGKNRNTGHHWFAGYGYPRSFLGNLAIQVNVPSQRRLPPITLKQDAIDELNKWKAHEAAKKLKQNEK